MQLQNRETWFSITQELLGVRVIELGYLMRYNDDVDSGCSTKGTGRS